MEHFDTAGKLRPEAGVFSFLSANREEIVRISREARKSRMTLLQQTIGSLPEETARVARAAYPNGTISLQLRDALGPIYQDQSFAHLFPHNGRPVEAPWCLALIPILQFMEELPDRQAADAVRGRIDWKYLLGLDLTDPGFDATVLCEFRTRLVQGDAAQILLDTLLDVFKKQGWLKGKGSQRTDSTHVLAKIRACNRRMCVGEAMRFVLGSIAIVADGWLLHHSDDTWVLRYGHRIEEVHLPKAATERTALAEEIGRDGSTLLTDIFDPHAPVFLCEIPAVQILRQIWTQNYYWDEGVLRWRESGDLPPQKQCINSPYDPEARFRKKRSTMWTGYAVHLTEVCDDESPHLITHVATTLASTTDDAMTEPIHHDLQHNELLPTHHMLDSGYITAHLLATSQQAFGVELVGPGRVNVRWQASTPQGIDNSQFQSDWDHQQAICPEGRTSISWTPTKERSLREVIKIRFSTTDCRHCPRLAHCTYSKSKYPRRLLTVRPQQQHEALQMARQVQQTQRFTMQYARREGIEATISQGVRAFDLRRSRSVGLEKTRLQHVSIATALNLVRIAAWLRGESPAPTRVSAFERLFATA
jgi:transposase